MAVVVGAHARFYGPLLADFPPERLAIQPDDRGTAPALLYGLLRVMTVAPNSPIAVFPSDHHVSNDADFMAHVQSAVWVVSGRPDLVVLLGMLSDSTADGCSWIEPGDRIVGPWRSELYRARHFWEQPSPGLAAKLRARGCLWGSFVMVAYPCAVLNMVMSAVPSLLDTFAPVRMRLGTPWENSSVRRVYSRLPSMDFAKQVLQTCPANLAVLPLAGAGALAGAPSSVSV